MCRGGWFTIRQVGRSKGQQTALPFYDSIAGNSGIGTDVAVLVNHFDGDKTQVLSIGSDDTAVGSEVQTGRLVSGTKHCNPCISLGTQCSWLVWQCEDGLILRVFAHGLGADEPVVQIEFYFWGLRIDLHLDGLALPSGKHLSIASRDSG